MDDAGNPRYRTPLGCCSCHNALMQLSRVSVARRMAIAATVMPGRAPIESSGLEVPPSASVAGLRWSLRYGAGDRALTASGGCTLGLGGTQRTPGPQIVTRPPNVAVLLTRCGQSILKNSKFHATRCQILRLKCTKFYFRCGFAQTPLGELTDSPSSCI